MRFHGRRGKRERYDQERRVRRWRPDLEDDDHQAGSGQTQILD
jgi:hypothetical protein